MGKIQLTVIIWEEEGLYVSKCPEIEVASCGNSPQEALDNIHEAINLYIENARALGMMEEIESALRARHKFTSMIEVEA
ncbi:putative RNase H-like HicB family nuclease [Methanocalculus alkaliphilus]|uniref:type II toxin-antitoxin system HicB family antitoxin n=1 Tax=Methanocalculus alkaliphilus TaxID=768730 RepID=UPI0020A0A48E|nr:type II toxin-antitoxin system HicB family antitoxin [Methanocalculus alkaliphilus]MCP1715269.1 putative RNase H-like HicB family nuclease [Methanocalculus alkaliphilus]